ncbi:MAG: chromosome segregation protein SMC, partial [Deltaproteobacteria bacterium]
MHIKKLEICGFKSFVDRTVIHFDHDVIGVVGPNGCGKSNVVDAIRWAMGEQSAKALRGKAMGDVVFNGSETRPPAGFAEVTLTFDNSDPTMAQQLPLQYRDYSEIAVTRRAYRGDGSNDYFINKTPARLTDVDEVFLGTGVGRQAYSIIEQGKIGVIVSARAEDRRGLIEEAAGITKYKARRRQAENKMNLTRRNLVRVGDIVSEIERQVGSLKRQAAKARRFLRYRSELEHLMLWEASHKLLELIVLHAVAENSRAELTTKVASDRTEVDTRDAENEVLRQQAQDVEQQTERAQNAAFISDNDVRECETRQERAAERYVQLSGRLAQAQSEQLELERKATALDDERQDLASQLETVKHEQQSEQGHVQIEIDKLQALQLETDTANGRLATLRHDEAGAVASIARGEAELAGFEQRSSEMTQRQQRLSAELDRLAEEQGQLESQRETLTKQVAQLVSRKHAMCDARDALQNELPTLRDDVRERGTAVEEQRAELNRRSNRLQALEEVSERMEGVGAGVRNLLQSGDPALGGIIADRIEVPADFTAAVAGLVGDRLQCVVVDDLDRALELLRGLAAERQGRATIIPRQPSSATDPAHQPTPDLLTPAPSDTDDGVIGLLIDQVSFAPEDAAVVRALLGNALVVSDADCAKRLSAHQLPG